MPTRVRGRVAGSSARADVERFRAFADVGVGGVFNDLFRRVLKRVRSLSGWRLAPAPRQPDTEGFVFHGLTVLIHRIAHTVRELRRHLGQPDDCLYRFDLTEKSLGAVEFVMPLMFKKPLGMARSGRFIRRSLPSVPASVR